MGLPKNVVTWDKDGHRFIGKVEACNACYLTKHLFVKHLWET
jgi:hypothetical protein